MKNKRNIKSKGDRLNWILIDKYVLVPLDSLNIKGIEVIIKEKDNFLVR